jgi:Holliday junction resolvase RusA-like endonuclease
MNDRQSWREMLVGKKEWRDAAFWWAKQHRIKCRNAVGPVDVAIEFGTKQPDKRRDNSNFMPTVKAICDGFSAACIWEDDDNKHATQNVPTFTNTIPPNSLRVTLTWEEAE